MGMLAYMTWYFEDKKVKPTWDTFKTVRINKGIRIAYIAWWYDD